MAKKSVIIFDGEDLFINPKKNVYSKTKAEAKNLERFKSARGDSDGEMGRERIVEDVTSGGGGGSVPQAPIESTPISTPITTPVEQTASQAIKTTPVESSAPISVSKSTPSEPIYVPPIQVPPILPVDYIAPTPPPLRPPTPERRDPISGVLYKGEEGEPSGTPIFSIDDGTPAKPVVSVPTYTAPSPVLPKVEEPVLDPVFRTPPTRPTPPDWINPDDGSGGKYSGGGGDSTNPPLYKIDDGTPVKGGPDTNKLVPIEDEPKLVDCGEGFYRSELTGLCTKIPDVIVIPDPLDGGGSDANKDDKEIPPVPCPSGFMNHPVTGACVPIPSTEPVDDPCATPPLTPLLPGYKWTKSGDCNWNMTKLPDVVVETTTSTTTTTTTKAAPTTSTTTTTTTKAGGDVIVNTGLGLLPELPTGGGATGGGGGGGGSEEPLPTQEVAKKNYFWWYVIGGISLYLLLKRKK